MNLLFSRIQTTCDSRLGGFGHATSRTAGFFQNADNVGLKK
jgi:hypothetical protein